MLVQLASVSHRYTPEEVARFYAAGCWQQDSVAEMVRARAAAAPHQVLVHDDTRAVTFAEVDRDAAILAGALTAHGLTAGERVVVQLPNWVEFSVVVVALSRIGAVVVPLMPFYRRSEIAYVLEHAEVSMAFISPSVKNSDQLHLYRDMRAELPMLRDLVVVRDDERAAATELTWESLLAEGTGRPHVGPGTHPDEPFLVIYTSGTTAQPKGCLHTVNTLASSGRALRDAIHLSDHDVIFNPSPLANAQGVTNGLMMPLVSGSTVHVIDGFEPTRALETVQTHGCTVAMTAPTMLQMILDAPSCTAEQLRTFRIWMLSGAQVPPALLERSASLMPHARILSAYGRSENISATICLPEDPPEKTLATDGRALPHVSIHIVDDHGQEVSRGVEGDIAYRGPSHMLEYIRDPVETQRLFTGDGYSRSGDLGWMDEEGYLRVSGRIKDIIIRGGLNISVREVEDLLLEHPAVGRVAVVGMPDERLGERGCCFVELADPGCTVTLAELVDHLMHREIAVQKLPERLEIIERMPENASGKIQKAQLRAIAADLVAAGRLGELQDPSRCSRGGLRPARSRGSTSASS